MEELGSECTSHPLFLTVYRLAGVPNTGGSAIVYSMSRVKSAAEAAGAPETPTSATFNPECLHKTCSELVLGTVLP